MVQSGLLKDRAAVVSHAGELRELHVDPARNDIAWRLGIQPELLVSELRLTELRNWLDHFVQPEKSRRGRA